jgi:hypothetical protein
MNYTSYISLDDAIYFNLFDEIPFCQVKQFFQPWVDRDECNFEVDIEDLPCNKPGYKRVSFEFALMDEKTHLLKNFTKEREYHTSWGFAQRLSSLQIEDYPNNECSCGRLCLNDEDDTDEDDEKETEIKEPVKIKVTVRKITYYGESYLMSSDSKNGKYFSLYDVGTFEEIGVWCSDCNKPLLM